MTRYDDDLVRNEPGNLAPDDWLTPDGSPEHILAARIADRLLADVRSNLSHTEHITGTEWFNMRERFIDNARAILEETP